MSDNIYYDSSLQVYINNNKYYIKGSALLSSGIPQYKNSNKEKYYPIDKYDIDIVKSAIERKSGFLVVVQSKMPDNLKRLIVDNNKSNQLNDMFPSYDSLSSQQRNAFNQIYESDTRSRRR